MDLREPLLGVIEMLAFDKQSSECPTATIHVLLSLAETSPTPTSTVYRLAHLPF
jgi:hypothetical protein